MSDSENEENEAFVEYEWTGRDCQSAIAAASRMGVGVHNVSFMDGDLWISDEHEPRLLVIATRSGEAWAFDATPQGETFADAEIDCFTVHASTVRAAVHALADFVIIARENGGLKGREMRTLERCAMVFGGRK